jgi:glutathione-regulated potassium-efflux system ancillary protein KefC
MDLDSFMISAVILLAVTSVAVALFKHLGLGSVLGLLVAGVVVGPYSPGPYITTHVEDVRRFTELGVVLLLFVIGLDMKPRQLWALRRQVFGLGSLQILLSGALIGAYALTYAASWKTALLDGLTLALSSTAFVMQLLQDRGEVASRHGRTAFGILLMQDLAIVPLLAMVPFLSGAHVLSQGLPVWKLLSIVLGMLLLLWSFGRYVVPFALERLVRQNNREAFALVIMLAVFLSAWATHEAGLSMALGAFLMGMLLSGSRFNLQIQAHVEPFKGLLLSLFFVAVGMSIDIGAIVAHPLDFSMRVMAILGIKILVLLALCLAFGLARSVALRVTFLLAQSGEFGFVLFGSAKALGVITDITFAISVGVISVSMLLTPLLVRLGDRLARRQETYEGGTGTLPHDLHGEDSDVRVIIGGYGRVGHTVAVLLHSSGVPFIAFDSDPARVIQGRQDGFRVFYGDIGDPGLLVAARIERVDLVIVTVDDVPTALRAVSHIHTGYPRVTVITRARDLASSGLLVRAGATLALPEALEASMRLGAAALEALGITSDDVEDLLRSARREDYALIRSAINGNEDPE